MIMHANIIDLLACTDHALLELSKHYTSHVVSPCGLLVVRFNTLIHYRYSQC